MKPTRQITCADCGLEWSHEHKGGPWPERCQPCRHARELKMRIEWKRRRTRVCEIEGCDKKMDSRRMCGMHYKRWKLYGEPGHARRIYEEMPPGTPRINGNGYVYWTTLGHIVYEHRYVMERKLRRPLQSFENVHHINGVRHDNRPENLELWCKPQPGGQRVEDLVKWAVETYPDLAWATLLLAKTRKEVSAAPAGVMQ